MSDGVFIRCSTFAILIMLSNVRITVTIPVSTAPDATDFFIAFMFPAPKCCAVTTVNPAVTPCRNPMIRNTSVPHAPTAASAAFPTNFPTITVSAIL